MNITRTYKDWSIEELKDKGMQLAIALKRCTREVPADELSMTDIEIITKGHLTLEELRKEYKRRIK